MYKNFPITLKENMRKNYKPNNTNNMSHELWDVANNHIEIQVMKLNEITRILGVERIPKMFKDHA
jgi:hypothetical protein